MGTALDPAKFHRRVAFADLLELVILGMGESVMSLHSIRTSLPSTWNVEDLRFGHAISEMRRRQQVLGPNYPFSVEDGFVRQQPNSSAYASLLSLSSAGLLANFQNPPLIPSPAELLEDVVERCLSGFFGNNTRMVNFGWPSRNGRPQEFAQAVAWLAAKMGVELGSAYRSPSKKDGGVDLVVWKEFGDKRVGTPIVLCQVTLQRDFVPKARDIDRRIWSGWLAVDSDPVVALCVPFVLENSEDWFEVSRNALPLDRLRLCGESLHSYASVNAEKVFLEAVLERIVAELE